MWNFKNSAEKNKVTTKNDTPIKNKKIIKVEKIKLDKPLQKPATETPIKTSQSKLDEKRKLNEEDHYYQIKNKLHEDLIKQIDLKIISSMPSEEIKAVIEKLVNSILNDHKIPVNEDERENLVIDLQNEILGLGPLEKLLADSSISEIMINKFDRIFVERAGRVVRINQRFNDNQHLLKIIDKIVTRVGRRIDELNPMADARLEDGSRVNAIIPPVALDGPAMSIRKFAVVPFKIEDLIQKKTLTKEIAELLSALVQAKTNILISGGTGSGKTTLLNILSGFIPNNERIITIEDTAELQMQQDHVVRLESRPPNIEEKGEITIRSLVRNSLRMRPDRIVLGEVRGGEVIDMLQAMNTGHDGSLATVHANSARDALSRLESLIGLGGISNVSTKVLRQQISSAINVIIQISRLNDGSRKIMSIHEITGMEGDVITTQEIFYFDRKSTDKDGNVEGEFKATGVRPQLAERISAYGIPLSKDIFNPDYILK